MQTSPYTAAAMAFVGVIVAELVVILRSMKTRGVGRQAGYMSSRTLWIYLILIAAIASLVAGLNHELATGLAWSYFGISFPALVAQMANKSPTVP